jgi:hypothetical protein
VFPNGTYALKGDEFDGCLPLGMDSDRSGCVSCLSNSPIGGTGGEHAGARRPNPVPAPAAVVPPDRCARRRELDEQSGGRSGEAPQPSEATHVVLNRD